MLANINCIQFGSDLMKRLVTTAFICLLPITIWFGSVVPITADRDQEHPTLGDSVVLVNPNSDNPFVTYDARPGNKYHAFVDYSGVHGIYPEQIALDYFGFRNDRDLYFDIDRDYTLVVLTGGSESAGYSHRTTIAEHLEKVLNEVTERTCRVLNLGMNSYCLPNEINTYVNLAYHLKPEIVVSHTGWNDFFYARMVPYNFKRLGLFFPNICGNGFPASLTCKNRKALVGC